MIIHDDYEKNLIRAFITDYIEDGMTAEDFLFGAMEAHIEGAEEASYDDAVRDFIHTFLYVLEEYAYEKTDQQIRSLVLRFFASLDVSVDEGFSHITGFLTDGDEELVLVLAVAAQIVGLLGGGHLVSRSVPALIVALRRGTSDDHKDETSKAIAAIGIPAIPYLKQALESLDDNDWEQQQEIVWTLGRIRHPSAADILGSLLTKSLLGDIDDDDDMTLRTEVIHALGAIGYQTDRVIPLLIQSLSHKSRHVRRASVDTIVKMGGHAIPFICNALKSHNNLTCRGAITAAGLIHHNGAVLPLIALFGYHKERRIRIHAAISLGSIVARSRKSLTNIAYALQAPNPLVREGVCIAIRVGAANGAQFPPSITNLLLKLSEDGCASVSAAARSAQKAVQINRHNTRSGNSCAPT